MASSVRRMAVYLGLVEDDSYSDDYADDSYEEPRISRSSPDKYESRVQGSNRAGSSRAGSSRAGSSRAGSSRAGSSRAGSSRAGSDRAGSDRAGSDRAGSDRAGSDRAGSSRGFADGYGHEDAESSEGSQAREPRGVRTIRRDQDLPSRNVAPGPTPPRNFDFGRIESIHPRSYNDARRIGEEYREGIPVIMNLGDLDDSDAKRIIDFAAGLVFGCRGSIERVTSKVFLLSPVNVDVGDQARAQVAQDGFFNQS